MADSCWVRILGLRWMGYSSELVRVVTIALSCRALWLVERALVEFVATMSVLEASGNCIFLSALS